jgi:hypothetical protein
MLTLLAIAAITWPKTMATSVAGVSITTQEMVSRCWHDAKSGYYVYNTIDCDGGHKSITLTKDRRLVGEVGYDTSRFGRKPKNDPIGQIGQRSLKESAGNGIRIGMTPQQLKARLGKPTKTATRGKNREFWCAMYKKVQMETKEEGRVLRNTYIFKNSKLIEISVNLDHVPGCGEDSLSDEGWPWTHF